MKANALILLCCVFLFLGNSVASPPSQTPIPDANSVFVTVGHVVDGDTIALTDENSVRLIVFAVSVKWDRE